MPIMVDLHLVLAGLLMTLAAITTAIHMATKVGSALAWLAGTLFCVGAETLVFRYANGSAIGLTLVTLLLPLAYLCAGNAIRQSLRLEIASPKQVAIFAGLIALSLVLLLAEAPAYIQSVPFQLAGFYIFFEAIRIQIRQRFKTDLDKWLIALCIGSMTGLAVRAPMFPLLLGEPTPFQYMSAEVFEGIFINTLSLLSSALAAFLIAKIVSNVIRAHKHLAEHDDLTGLLNRRTFDKIANKLDDSQGSVIMCDIDHFKAVNDLYGHHVGDDVIQTFACILTHHSDYAGRLGGEEFALILVDTPIEDAAIIAEEIRAEFYQSRHHSMGEDAAISASFGVAPFNRFRPIHTAIRTADKALYEAKRTGRNRICGHIQPGPIEDLPILEPA